MKDRNSIGFGVGGRFFVLFLCRGRKGMVLSIVSVSKLTVILCRSNILFFCAFVVDIDLFLMSAHRNCLGSSLS